MEEKALQKALLGFKAKKTVGILRAVVSAWNAVESTAGSRPERPTFGSSQALQLKRFGTSDSAMRRYEAPIEYRVHVLRVS